VIDLRDIAQYALRRSVATYQRQVCIAAGVRDRSDIGHAMQRVVGSR
jgi:hypothetical protein